MKTRPLHYISFALAASALSASSLAQSALLRQGDPSPSGATGQTIDDIGALAINQTGGFGAGYTTDGTSGEIDGFWGSFTPGAGTVLREQATIGTADQTSMDATFGMSASSLAYVSQIDDLVAGGSLESVWIDDTLIGDADDPIPSTTFTWSFFTNAGVTQSGVPYFVAGLRDAQGIPFGRGLFVGTNPTALYQTGDVIPNMPFPLSGSAVDFDFRFSPNGTHNMVEMDLDTGSSTDDRAMSIDGEGLLLGGALTREDQPIPASVGGLPGELWDSFDTYAITEAGDYMVTGDTNGDTSLDEFIVRNGSIWHREGDVIDGEVVLDSIEGAALSEGNEITYIWDIDVGGATVEALFYEETLLLQEGDAVDWDGDGSLDAGTSITNFLGFGGDGLAITNNGVIYFLAEVDVNGTVLRGFFEFPVTVEVDRYCSPGVPNTTGLSGQIDALGNIVAASNNLTLTATNLPDGEFAYFLASRTPGFVSMPNGSQGNLCVVGNIARFNAQVVQVTAGAVSIAVDLTDIPEPPNFGVSVMAGETWNFQCWHRDFVVGQGPTSNFTDAIGITFQ